jgi:hypothetical protein
MKALIRFIEIYAYLHRECKWTRMRALRRAWQCI